ncbi:MAG TPA: BBP7 family outer membrane beta-barrel protein [Candidatus Anammoximicrobium sp.]|nr:BBP7 family outer membrane beta-barrel protein [Candidatus Anammoximicrobium sp.]
MKIQWAWRASVLAVLALVVLQAESRGQVYYGQPYGAPPQMIYVPSGAAYGYGSGPAAVAWPYAVPASYDETQPPETGTPSDFEPSAECGEAACEAGNEYFLEGGQGGRCSPLASVLSWLAPYSETSCCAPHWFDVHAEAVFLRRDDDAPFREFTRLGPLGDAVITSADLDFSTMDPSLRITGVYQTGPGSNLEFTYFGLNESSEESSATSAADLLYAAFDNFSIDDNGFPVPEAEIEQVHQAQFQRVNLDSDFDSLELNFRRRWMGPTCLVQGSWVIGVRYFELEDQLRFYSYANRDLDDPLGEGQEETGGEAWYNLRTRNFMTGAQLGGDIWVCLLPGLRAGMDVKAGIYGNNVKVNTFMAGEDPYDPDPDNRYRVFIGPESQGNDKISFIGELQLMLTYQLSHNFTLRGGYQMMFVEGVATALDNFNPTITERVPWMADGGSLFYDGFTIGAEYMW